MAGERDDISPEGKLILRCLEDFQRGQAAQWQTQDAAVIRLHDRIDQMANSMANSIKELALANANNITREDCERCKKDQQDTEDKKHGVSPKVAYIGIPLIIWSLTTLVQHAKDIGHWLVLVFKGG